LIASEHSLFHHPIFWSFSGTEAEVLEQRILERADQYLEAFRQRGVTTLDEVLKAVLWEKLPLSQDDKDLAP